MTRRSAPLRGSLLRVTLAAALCLTAVAAEHGAAPPALFVLGDSLSDVGNAAALADRMLGGTPSVGLCNPVEVLVLDAGCTDVFYRASRVSDGPVAVEHLAAHLGLPDLAPSRHLVLDRDARGTDYAVASAKARGQDMEDLDRQTDMLVLDHGPLLPADALYVVMIGGNDAIDALQALARPGAGEAERSTTIAATAAAIERALDRLLRHGARRVIVANVPNLAVLPAVRAAAGRTADPGGTLTAAQAVSEELNAAIAAALDRLAAEHTNATILRFDLAAALERALNEAASNGRNARDACFDSVAYRASPTAERAYHPDCTPAGGAPRFGEFAFWDGLHPTGALHAEIGRALIELYENPTV